MARCQCAEGRGRSRPVRNMRLMVDRLALERVSRRVLVTCYRHTNNGPHAYVQAPPTRQSWQLAARGDTARIVSTHSLCLLQAGSILATPATQMSAQPHRSVTTFTS